MNMQIQVCLNKFQTCLTMSKRNQKHENSVEKIPHLGINVM